MPQFPNAGPFNQQDPFVLPGSGVVTPSQARWLLGIAGQLAAIQTVVNNNFGTNLLPLASQPTLGASDVGYVMYVTDYAHLVYWDGSAWQWLDGDRPGRFDHFASAPGTGWGVCDGSTYALLTVGGATLTTTNLVTPDLSGTAAYLKSAAAYTGTINAKGGSTATGTTGTPTAGITIGTTQFGVLADANADGAQIEVADHLSGFRGVADNGTQTHPIPALGVGSIEMANLATLVYVRR